MKARSDEIKKIGRLLKRADFLRLQAAAGSGAGRKWVTPYVILQVLPVLAPPEAEAALPIRYGLTLTKKIFPRAVDRNRVRRRYRALFLSVIGEFPAAAGYDFALLPRFPALAAESEILEKDLKWALKRVLSPDFRSKKAETGKNHG